MLTRAPVLPPLLLAGLLAALAAGPVACKTTPDAPAAPQRLTVVGISDFHGALEPVLLRSAGGREVPVGGAALMSAYLERIRERAPGPVLLLDAGDMYQGTLASGMAEGAPVISLYDHLGVAAAALGNHEFDFGPVGPDGVVREEGQDPRGALRARIEEAGFPFLAANLRAEGGGDEVPEPFQASHLVEVGEWQVGIVGLASINTASTTVARNLVGLTFVDPVPVAVAEARRLRAAGADLVIVLLHDGSYCSPALGEGLEGCAEGELLRLQAGLPEGLVDLILGAHTHGLVARRVGNRALLQGAARGQFLSWAELAPGQPPVVHAPVQLCGATVPGAEGPTCEKKAVQASEVEPEAATFLGAPLLPDPEVAALVAPALEQARVLEARPLGVSLAAPFTRAYGEESALGNLVADAFRAAVEGAQIGLTNGGGLRADLPAGEMRWGHVFQALPFDNHLAVLKLEGAQLRRLVQHGIDSGHGALSYSGLSLEARGCELLSIRIGEAPLDDAATYTLVTNDYLSGGGSGFDTLAIPGDRIEVLWERPLLREIVADHLGGLQGPLEPASYFDPASPRQRRDGDCKPARKAGS
ncbi:MAG: bifunctional UDP-sugar hydrolase/5'-nucleotidase [Deltaproteobacteria bacterium]|nr:bifunctional UDP-sugar hydrolase/5'-nucleotidase [Deltaproteobacteria bacterium]